MFFVLLRLLNRRYHNFEGYAQSSGGFQSSKSPKATRFGPEVVGGLVSNQVHSERSYQHLGCSRSSGGSSGYGVSGPGSFSTASAGLGGDDLHNVRHGSAHSNGGGNDSDGSRRRPLEPVPMIPPREVVAHLTRDQRTQYLKEKGKEKKKEHHDVDQVTGTAHSSLFLLCLFYLSHARLCYSVCSCVSKFCYCVCIFIYMETYHAATI